jgi:predicted nucleic acid-binding protein
MRVLIDVNVVLDVILERRPWLEDSKGVWDACHETRIAGHLIATAVTNIFYVSRRLIGTEKARAGVRICLATFEIVPVGRDELEKADAMAGSDLEDNVSSACALAAGLDAIVTRDPRGFAGSPIPVLSPTDLLARLPKGEPGEADRERGPSGDAGSPGPQAGPDLGR